MPRTTADAVKKICPLKKKSDDLYPFIEVANHLVTNVCVNDTSDYTDATLEMIERWLAAHFYCILRNQRRFESAGRVQQALDSKVDLGLRQTRYGDQALMIDYAGNLALLDNALKTSKKTLGAYAISVKWLGVEFPEHE